MKSFEGGGTVSCRSVNSTVLSGTGGGNDQLSCRVLQVHIKYSIEASKNTFAS